MNKQITTTSSIIQKIIDVDRSLVRTDLIKQTVKFNNEDYKEGEGEEDKIQNLSLHLKRKREAAAEEEEEEQEDDQNKRKRHVSTQIIATDSEPILISNDYFDYNQELEEGFTYRIQSFYNSTNITTTASILPQL